MIARILTALRAGYEAATNNYRGESDPILVVPAGQPAGLPAPAATAPGDNMVIRAELVRLVTLIDDTSLTVADATAVIRGRITELRDDATRPRP
jgi:hypothetical protein